MGPSPETNSQSHTRGQGGHTAKETWGTGYTRMAEKANLDPPPHTVHGNQLEMGTDLTGKAERTKYLKGNIEQLCDF